MSKNWLAVVLGATTLLAFPGVVAAQHHGGGGHGGGYHGGGYHGGAVYHGGGYHGGAVYHGGYYHGGYYGGYRGYYPGYRGYYGYRGYGYYPGLYAAGLALAYAGYPYYYGGYYGPSAYGTPDPYTSLYYSPPAVQPYIPPALARNVNPKSVTVDVRVPPDATIWFGDSKTSQTGSTRTFISPPLEPGKVFAYDIHAQWTEGDKVVNRTKEVKVQAGQRVEVNFMNQ